MPPKNYVTNVNKDKSLQDQILAQAKEFVAEVGNLPEQLVGPKGPTVEVPGREGKKDQEGNGPCYYFAKRFCEWLKYQLENNPEFKNVRVSTIVIDPTPGTNAVSHIIVKIVLTQGSKRITLFFDAGTGDRFNAGNMGGVNGQINENFLSKEDREKQGIPIIKPMKP